MSWFRAFAKEFLTEQEKFGHRPTVFVALVQSTAYVLQRPLNQGLSEERQLCQAVASLTSQPPDEIAIGHVVKVDISDPRLTVEFPDDQGAIHVFLGPHNIIPLGRPVEPPP